MRPKYTLGEKSYEVAPVRRGATLTLRIDGRDVELVYERTSEHRLDLVVAGRRHTCHVAVRDREVFVQLADGTSHRVEIADEFASAAAGPGSGGAVRAPMPGAVVEVRVAVGDAVEAGTVVMTIESMKLLVELQAPVAGVVAAVGYVAGDTFGRGALLLDIAPRTES